MARLRDREKALDLRKQGLSYSQIKQQLKVSKSTLSIWLRDYPLSRERINELRANSERRIERFSETMRRKREARLLKVYNEQKEILSALTEREIFIAGLFLYLGEGAKTKSEASLSNTNPTIIKSFIYWLATIYKIPKQKIKVRLHLYQDMDIESEVLYWMNTLNLERSNFRTPYIKKNSQNRINYLGGFGHGTCNIIVGGVPLFEKIMMSIKVITDQILENYPDFQNEIINGPVA